MNAKNKCCFKNKSEKYITKAGIIYSIISILLLLWGIIELNYDTDIIKYFYYISFGLIILCFFGFISILILLSERINKDKINVNKTIKYISIIIFFISLYSFILLIIHFIVEIIDYVNAEKILPSEMHIPYKDWLAIFIPSLISFICLIFIIIASKTLYESQNSETNTINENNTVSIVDSNYMQSSMAVLGSLKKKVDDKAFEVELKICN